MAGDTQNKYDALLKRALAEIRTLKQRVASGSLAREPIAIVGLGCRFPGGVESPESFWQLLHDGVDAIGEVPADRWDADALYSADRETPGTICTRAGGFVPRLDEFDAEFFRIAPTEAASVDPQQRLLLEVTWEALEHAGIPATELSGTDAGVFVGICSEDYYTLLASRDLAAIDPYMKSGNAHSVAAGRISYYLGLRGPSLAIDTACSSSLVAVHLACQSLRLGECNLALAGGVNRMITPESSVNFSRAGMLSPTGRCKTFDASADGYVRGEGCGVVVLRRLSDARARGERILAVIRGSAVNQDGRTSGLTVPSGPSQQRVVERALADSGIPASRVSYIEAHGTGTSLGDPIELGALGSVFTRDRDRWVGSVKTNIGHLEGAAGVAGLIKVVLSLQHRTIPRHLHCEHPTPRVEWGSLPFSIPVQRTAWPAGNDPRVAGVSSFGFGGTNAHLVIEEWTDDAPLVRQAPREHVLTMSAQSEPALRSLAERTLQHFSRVDADQFGALCFTSNVGRSHLPWRLAIVAKSLAEARAALTSYVRGERGDWIASEKPVEIGESKAAGAAADVAARYVAGARIDWTGFHAAADMRRVDLPTYPFQRQRHWFKAATPALAASESQRFYRVEWEKTARAAASKSPDYLPTPDAVTTALARVSSHVAGYDGITAPAEAASVAFMVEALVQLGLPLTRGARFDPNTLPARLAIAPARVRLLTSMLDRLDHHGVIGKRDGQFEVLRVPGVPAVDELRAVMSRYPAATELRMVEHCGPRLADVLRGTCDPVKLLFPDDGTTGAGDLYRDAGGFQLMNELLGQAVRELIRDLPASRPLRIVEVGAGTGSATAAILPHLPADRTTYVFTDLSRGFFAEARKRFAAYPFVRYEALDLDADQSALDGSADLVIVANVVHATRDIRASLRRLKRLLMPGGALVLLESTARRAWLDLTFGLTDGWWCFEDHDLRTTSPLLNAADWIRVLNESGFEGASACAPAGEAVDFLAAQTVLIARADAAPRLPLKQPVSRWVTVGDDKSLARAFAARGAVCTPLSIEVPPDGQLLEGDGAGERVGLLIDCRDSSGDAESLSTSALESNVQRAAASLLSLSQRLIDSTGGPSVRIWVVTRDAYDAGRAHSPLSVELAPLIGLVRSLNTEQAQFQTTLIDITTGVDVDALCDELCRADADADREIALRPSGRWVPRLVPITPSVTATRRPRADATYLVTGAFGGIGTHAARWLVSRGARSVVLTSRSIQHPQVAPLVSELEGMGARVRAIAADISQPDDTARLFAEIQANLPPVRGVFHAATIWDNALLKDMTWRQMQHAYAPKILGAWNLHRHTRDLQLDWFVLFSSIASLIADPGIANYVSAGTFLDALAQHRRALGLPGQSLSWGIWSRTGYAEAMGAEVERDLAARGMIGFAPEEGLAHLEAALDDGGPGFVIARADWSKFLAQFNEPPALFERLMTRSAPAAAVDDITLQLRQASSSDRRRLLLAHVQTETAAVLGLADATTLDPGRGFFDLGMDSLTSMMLRNRLQSTFGCSLSPTVSFQYPTLERLADHLVTIVDADGRAPESPARPAAVATDESVDRRYQYMSEDDLAAELDRTLAALEVKS